MVSLQHTSRIAPVSAKEARASERLVFRNIRGERIACREWGVPGAPLCMGVHGLTANSLSFAEIGPVAAAAGYHVVVPDLRGRNLSPSTGALSYGWGNHARDVIAIADDVGAKNFSAIGHSMGAFIVMELGLLAQSRLTSAVLLDALGTSEPGAAAAIAGSVNRLGKTYPSADAYVDSIKKKGTIVPFTAMWDRHFREEVAPAEEGGVKPRTGVAAVYADTAYALAFGANPASFRALWASLPKKTLVIRAGVPLAPVLGNIVTKLDLANFKLLRSSAQIATVNASHYTVVSEPESLRTIGAFLKSKKV